MRQALNKIHRMPAEFHKEFGLFCAKRVLNRKDFILAKDQSSEHIYFLQEGVVRIFRHEANQPFTIWIITPGQVVHLPKRFFNDAGKSAVSVQALSESVVSSISLEQLNHLKIRYPDLKTLCEKISERFESNYEKYLRMLTRDGDARYDYVTEHFPNLQDSTYIGILASFMSMSKSTYYRCLKKRMKNGFENA